MIHPITGDPIPESLESMWQTLFSEVPSFQYWHRVLWEQKNGQK